MLQRDVCVWLCMCVLLAQWQTLICSSDCSPRDPNQGTTLGTLETDFSRDWLLSFRAFQQNRTSKPKVTIVQVITGSVRLSVGRATGFVTIMGWMKTRWIHTASKGKRQRAPLIHLTSKTNTPCSLKVCVCVCVCICMRARVCMYVCPGHICVNFGEGSHYQIPLSDRLDA